MSLQEEIIKYFEAKGRNYTELTVTAWYEVLEKYDLQAVKTAFSQLKKKADTMIDVGKVVEFIELDDADDAWNMALTCARNGGMYSLTARVAKALNSCGGMRRLMDASDKDLTWIKKEFDEIYPMIPRFSDVDGIRCLGLGGEILPDIEPEKLLKA